MTGTLRAGFALNEFDALSDMAGAAAAFCRDRLSEAIEERGEALFLVSGGSTPLPLYERLSTSDVDWSAVTILLVDERWVGLDDPASNETSIRRSLLKGRAAAGRLIGLKTDHAAARDAVPDLDATLRAAPWPADVAILGMGADGHVASWFPNAEGLAAALDPASDKLVAAITATPSAITGKHTERMTLTAPPVLSSGARVLLIAGDEKRRVYERGWTAGPVEELPVRALFRGPPERFFACWAP